MSPARPRARRGEGELLRDELLAATEALLIETGSEDAVSIRAVADRVGVTAPSIYRHFDDKQALLFEVCSRQFDRLKGHIDDALAGVTEPAARLEACGRAYVDFGLEHPEHYRIMFMGRTDWSPEQHPEAYAAVTGDESAFAALVDVVAEVVGVIDVDRDPVEVAVVLWTAMHGITSLLIAKPNFPWPPVDHLVGQVCASHLKGLFGHE